ncbi:MAG TPA: OmpA family protein [Prolixibacteraceae bacterium]|nr:OmpA family protein [Prolixibacteraceae bacterium]
MKHLFIAIFVLSCFSVLNAQEETRIKRPTVGLHFFYNDFITPGRIKADGLGEVLKNNDWNTFNNMEGGFGLDYLQGLTRNIDLVGTINGSRVNYLLPSGNLYGSTHYLVDINAGAHLKLLPDRYALSPFLIAKAGFTAYKDFSGFSLHPGAGIQLTLFKESFVFSTVEYRAALGNKVSNILYYSIGFATVVGKKKAAPPQPEPPPPPPPPPVPEPVVPARDVMVTINDEATGSPLTGANVELAGQDGKSLKLFTDEGGKATFRQVPPGTYTIRGVLNDINTTSGSIGNDDFRYQENGISVTLLHNDPRFTLSGVVINKTRNLPEGGAEIAVRNETLQMTQIRISNEEDGKFRSQLDAASDFTVVGKKTGYISNIERVSTKGLNRSATLYVKLELAIEEAKVGQSIVLSNIYFETGKSTILSEFSSDLDKLVQFLKDNPDTRLEIQGHTDNTGSLTVNNRLSQARAESVVVYLSGNGISKDRLTAKGYGPSLPLTANTTPEGRAKNRRVEMKVIQ